MLKKKIVKPTVKEQPKLAKKQVARQEPDEEIEEDTEDTEQDEDETEEETPPPKKKIGGAKILGKPKSNKSALAGAFSQVLKGSRGPASGVHEAVLVKMEDFTSGDGRVFIRSAYEICEELEGSNKVVGVTMILDAEGNPVWSAELVTNMLRKLDLELVGDITAEDLEQVYSEIEEKRPGCSIEVSYSDKGQMRVAFIDAVENETIEAYRENIPY